MGKRTCMWAGLLCVALGCAGPRDAPRAVLAAGEPERVVRQDGLGGPRKVRVGESLYRFRAFWQASAYPRTLTLDRPLTFRTETRSITLPYGADLAFLGTVTLDQVPYIEYFHAFGGSGLGEILYFRSDQTLAPFLYVKDKPTFPRGMETLKWTIPEAIKLPVSPSRTMLADRPYEDYELRFMGRDAGGIHLEYRAFGPDGAVLAEQTQLLTFPADAAQLRFRALRLELQSCSADQMVVTRLTD